MARNKSMSKSGWRKKDRAYRDTQRAKAKANREHKGLANLFALVTAPCEFTNNRAARRAESMAETQAILDDPDTMAALAEAEAEVPSPDELMASVTVEAFDPEAETFEEFIQR